MTTIHPVGNRTDQFIAGIMPKISIDSRLQVTDKNNHHPRESYVGPEREIKRLNFCLQILPGLTFRLARLLEYIELIRMTYHIDANSLAPMSIRVEIIIVDPVTKGKTTVESNITSGHMRPLGSEALLSAGNEVIDAVMESVGRALDEIVESHRGLSKTANDFAGIEI